MIDLGDPLPIETIEVTDAAGALANAGAMTLAVTLPDGSTASPGFTNPSTGRYVPNAYVTVQAGRHVARWVGSGLNASTYTEAFDVRPADTGAIISLADAKKHLNKSGSVVTDDEELRGMIDAATDIVESDPDVGLGVVIRRTIGPRAVAAASTCDLYLPVGPVISLTSLVPEAGGAALTVADLTVDSYGHVYRTLGGPLGYSSRWIATWVAGINPTPASAIFAAKVLIKHMWDTQMGGRTGNAQIIGAGPEEYTQLSSGYLIPNRAATALRAARARTGWLYAAVG
jgi:hypothetical protein